MPITPPVRADAWTCTQRLNANGKVGEQTKQHESEFVVGMATLFHNKFRFFMSMYTLPI
jgi:hypothetical protein